MNRFDEMRQAIQEAKVTLSAADNAANQMARILHGRLRKVSPCVLADLKKELKEFNAHTNRWKS